MLLSTAEFFKRTAVLIIFIILVIIAAAFTCCNTPEEQESNELQLKVNYAGEYDIWIYNTNSEFTALYILCAQKNETILTQFDMESKLNELGTLDIRVHKILGVAYPDNGILSLSIGYEDDYIEDVAGYGDDKAELIYEL